MPIVNDSSDPDIVVKRYMEPGTGMVYANYYYKRKPMPQVALASPVSEQLAGYVLIEKDLSNARRWLERIEKLVDAANLDPKRPYISGGDREIHDLVKGLFVAALTFYAKAFTKCDGRRAQLGRNSLRAELREQHDLFMLYRNSFAAHSGREKVEHAKTSLLLHPKQGKGFEPRIVVNRVQPDFVLMKTPGTGLPVLIADALRVVNEQHDKLTSRIMEKEIRPKGLDYWYKQAKAKK